MTRVILEPGPLCIIHSYRRLTRKLGDLSAWGLCTNGPMPGCRTQYHQNVNKELVPYSHRGIWSIEIQTAESPNERLLLNLVVDDPSVRQRMMKSGSRSIEVTNPRPRLRISSKTRSQIVRRFGRRS